MIRYTLTLALNALDHSAMGADPLLIKKSLYDQVDTERQHPLTLALNALDQFAMGVDPLLIKKSLYDQIHINSCS